MPLSSCCGHGLSLPASGHLLTHAYSGILRPQLSCGSVPVGAPTLCPPTHLGAHLEDIVGTLAATRALPAIPGPTWKTSLAHLRHRLCWQGRITTGLENISRQMGQMSCFSRLSMLCASPSSGLKPTVKFIPRRSRACLGCGPVPGLPAACAPLPCKL